MLRTIRPFVLICVLLLVLSFPIAKASYPPTLLWSYSTPSDIWEINMSYNGEAIGFTSEEGLQVLDSSGKLKWVYKNNPGSVSFSTDGRLVATGCNNDGDTYNSAALLSVDTGEVIWEKRFLGTPRILGTGAYIIIDDGMVEASTLVNGAGEVLQEFQNEVAGPYFSVAPNGQYYAFQVLAPLDGLNVMESPYKPLFHKRGGLNASFSDSGQRIAIRSLNSVELYDPRGTRLCTISLYNSNQVVLSGQGSHLLIITSNEITYYDVQGRLLWTKQVPGTIKDAVVSPDGDKVIVAVSGAKNKGELYFYDGSGQLLGNSVLGEPLIYYSKALYLSQSGSNLLVGGQNHIYYYQVN